MTTQIKRRRGTTTQHASFTGAEGELTIDTTKDTVVVHDGTTSGGHPLAKESAITGKVDKAGDTMTGDLTVPNVIVSGNVDGRDVSADGTKLDGIEASADVTDATNVAAAGAAMETGAAFTGDVSFGDNDKAIFGAGSDLQLYHDVADNNSYIKESGTGDLKIQGANVRLENPSGVRYFQGSSGISYLYNSGDIKLNTSASGIDVTGTVTADSLTVDGNVSLNGGTSSTTISADANRSGAGFQITGLRGKWNGTNAANIGIYTGSDTSNKDDGIVKIQTSEFLGTLRDRMRIDSNGDISFYEDTGTTPKFFWDASAESLGIGTSSPAQKLTISGGSSDVTMLWNSTDTAYHNFGIQKDGTLIKMGEFNNDGTTLAAAILNIEMNGDKVGIGTSSPDHTLRVNGDARLGNLHFKTSDFGAGGTGKSIYADAAGLGVLGFISTTAFDFSNGFSSRLRIDSSGNVGIGTSSPSAPLDIAGTSGTESFRIGSTVGGTDFGITVTENDGVLLNAAEGATGRHMKFATGGTERMRIDSSGNVGIGTSSPQANLDITGSSTSSIALRMVNTEPTEDSIGSFFSSGSAYSYIGIGANETALYGRTGLVLAADNPGSGWNPIRFSTGGSERMRIDSSGRVGIGAVPNTNWRNDLADQEVLMLGTEATFFSDTGITTELWNNAYVDNSDTFKNISTRGASRYFQYDGAHKWFTAASASAGSTITTEINTTPKMTLDVSGNLLLGTNDVFVGSGIAPKMTISKSGGSGLGINSIGSAEVGLATRPSASHNYYAGFFLNSSGTGVGNIAVTASSTAYNTSSDYRLKTDAQPMTGASARVQALNPVNFEWIADGTRVDGFLAHEAQAVVPEAVTGTKDAVDADGNPDYQGIDQSKLVPLLTAALQEALTKIDALETRITALEG